MQIWTKAIEFADLDEKKFYIGSNWTINEEVNKKKETQSATNVTDKKKWVNNMSSTQLSNQNLSSDQGL